MDNSISSVPASKAERIKKFIIIATIFVATICALLAIIAIFAGAEPTLTNLVCTLLILYLAMVYSTKNISSLDNPLPMVRLLSGIALLANIFWSLFWILLVWDAFGALSVESRDTIWRLVGSAAVVSVFCSILAFSIARVFSIHYPAVITIYKSLPLVCAGFFGIDILLVIWLPEADVDILGKFFLAECILLLLQWIVTRILISNASRLNIDMGVYAQNNNPIQQPVTQLNPDGAPNTTNQVQPATQVVSGQFQQPQVAPAPSALKIILIILAVIFLGPAILGLIINLIFMSMR